MKNVKISKKLVSLIAAGILMVSPIIAGAEGNTNENTDYGFTLVRQEMKVEGNDLNIDSYIRELSGSYKYLSQFFDDEDLQAKLQILYTIYNRPYMSSTTYNELALEGVIFSDEYINENFNSAFELIYRINEYNERTIREDYLNGTMDINHLIDPSVLCFDSHDKKIVRNAFEHYFEAYKNGRFLNNDYTEAFKIITTLNSAEKEDNAIHAETGATWGLQMTIGRQMMRMLEEDMLAKYSIDELSEYFVREKLEAEPREWVLRDDVLPDFECMSELELEISQYKQLETFCYKFVNNNIYKIFNITRNLETANPFEFYEHVENNMGEQPVVEKVEIDTTEAVDERDYSYGECVDIALSQLDGKISYDHLREHANCLVYLGNREYLTPEEEASLIAAGVVYNTDFSSAEGTQNFVQAYELIGSILDYNQSVIRNDFKNGTMDINHLIDPSIFCMNANDRKIVHALHVAYFEAYRNGRFDNDYCRYVIYELISNKEISFGPMWIARNIVGYDVTQMLMDDMKDDFNSSEVVKYFDNVELIGEQWVIRPGVEPSAESSDELEREAAYYKALNPVITSYVNDDLFESFGLDCSHTK